MNKYSEHIKEEIINRQNRKKSIWLENYIKHDIKSLGVGIPEIRKIIIAINNEFDLSNLNLSEQTILLDDLMQNQYTEYKLAAILYIQLFWQKTETNTILNLISDWFDKEWISDWNVCDWLCVRIISPLIDTKPEITISEITNWNKDGYLWKARASLVPFAQCKSLKTHNLVITRFSEALIKRPERFCKTSVGWVLREYSKIDSRYVISFLEQYKDYTTKEVIKNATKYFKTN
jgi:3-methyladenine DNA glycosylase AlkD